MTLTEEQVIEKIRAKTDSMSYEQKDDFSEVLAEVIQRGVSDIDKALEIAEKVLSREKSKTVHIKKYI